MCLIIYKPEAGKIPSNILDNAENINSDGFGIVFLDTLETIKTLDYDKARALAESERPFVLHYRYATKGSISKKNCHPFKLKHTDGEHQLFANGTVPLGDSKKTDSQAVAELLATVPEKHWEAVLSLTETRFAIVSPYGTVTLTGLWHERDGVFYSKADCFPAKKTKKVWTWKRERSWDVEVDGDECSFDWYDVKFSEKLPETGDLVAVYGTLKKGRGNHHYLKGAQSVGSGTTCNKYLMVDHGIPYVYEQTLPPTQGHRIVVEVYRPNSASAWKGLDSLEGHPHHYERKLISVDVNGEMMTAWLYFASHSPQTGETFIAEF